MRYYEHSAGQDSAMPEAFDYETVNEECVNIAINFNDVLESYEFEDDLIEDGEFDKSKTHDWDNLKG